MWTDKGANMIRDLTMLYRDLTESRIVNVLIKENCISVLIVSDWFLNQSQNERLDYLAEGIQVVYPEIIDTHRIHFIALTHSEANAFLPKTA